MVNNLWKFTVTVLFPSNCETFTTEDEEEAAEAATLANNDDEGFTRDRELSRNNN
jgi:hypothetical protein